MVRRLMIVVLCASLASPTWSRAQAPDCSAAVYRQFDFWLGHWDVADAQGKPQGTNRIDSILDGCALQETWTGLGESVGLSVNTYDRTTGQWRQTWVDNNGQVLIVVGGLVDGAMVLEGPGRAPDGRAVTHRVTWTPLDDGRVRQHWQTSADGGTTWQDAFVGFYSRK